MPWNAPQPNEHWDRRQTALFGTEIWARAKFFGFTWNPTVIAASTMGTYTMAATGSPDILTGSCVGLRVGMGIKLTGPSPPAPGLVWDATVTASDTLTIWIQNLSGSPATPPQGVWQVWGMIT